MTSRREVIAAGLALPALLRRPGLALESTTAVRPLRVRAQRVVVIGAGAFGGWTALHLARRGAAVTLIDAWGAGHARASSGGETRVIRGAYHGEQVYIDMVRRAFDLWSEYERSWGRSVFRKTGALWMFESADDAYVRTSVGPMRAAQLPATELTPHEAGRRFPQIRFDGVRRIWWEEEAGYLLAREACELVREACVRAGVEYIAAEARPGAISGNSMRHLALSDGTRREGDVFVFACGPWLGGLFPDVIGRRIRATKQDVLYFGTPAGDARFDAGSLPVWVNFGPELMYGIPGNERRGFKIADDTLGIDVDPTSFERRPSPEGIAKARALLGRRFPLLADAPLVHAEVCQYEPTPDGHYLMDWHPGATNVLLLGGGSGHGFKMGPALGERAARLVLGEAPVVPLFAYQRLRTLPTSGR